MTDEEHENFSNKLLQHLNLYNLNFYEKIYPFFLIFFSVITFAYKIWNIDYSYFANEAKLTDIIRITQSDGTVQSLPGIWNLTFSSSRRGEILQCMKESDHHNLNLCGANTYNIKSFSAWPIYRVYMIWLGMGRL